MKNLIKYQVKKHEAVTVNTIQFSAVFKKEGDVYSVTKNGETAQFLGFNRAWKYFNGGRV